ncbi:female-specific protein transformer [Orussus abietinus]|uniref:female-specific protein transformer n=1 Tax=Orussus abietinus TaxID=222816 RepID=UPI0006266BF9|nr:female-specific protein transformer [Orussus abietinus]
MGPSKDRNEMRRSSSSARNEEERERRRREWLIQQEREREHERHKQKMILEYERRRAREKGLNRSERTSSHSKSRSRSSEIQPSAKFKCDTLNLSIMPEKCQSSSGSVPLFKGPEGTLVSVNELRRIKIDIHRNIPGATDATSLHRDIINPEDVVLKRREGEGSKPIFEREELKRIDDKVNEVEERRTIMTVDNTKIVKKSHSSRNHSTSLSPTRKRHGRVRESSPHHSRDEGCRDSKSDSRRSRRSDRENDHQSKKSRGRDRSREGTLRRAASSSRFSDRSRGRTPSRERSRSMDRDQRKYTHDTNRRTEGFHRSSRRRSRNDSHDRRDDRSRDIGIPPSHHYIEHVPIPVYYGNFPPRPMMMGPMLPMRGQIPMMRNRIPFGARLPFPPRFIPPNMYRPSSSNPRMNQMF